MNGLDLLGQRFGKLTITALLGKRQVGKERRDCCRVRCDCGQEFQAIIKALRSGNTRSCGCLRKDTLTRHGGTKGKKFTGAYGSWADMMKRCLNPNAKQFLNYGGRGIGVCERWQCFDNFLADMGQRPPDTSLDRINNEGNYEPGNCRWATRVQQNRNTRQNQYIEFNGERLCITEWAVRMGIGPGTVRYRIRQGWPTELALTARPSFKHRKENYARA